MKIIALLLTVLAACAGSAGPHTTIDTTTQGVTAIPWTPHTIVPGASTGTHVGADGLDIQHGVAVVPWEQGNSVTTTVLATGATTTYALSQSAPEDARLCDLDGDGTDDIVVASSGKRAVYVIWGGTTTWVQLSASLLHGAWIQVGCADLNGDGQLDIYGGSYAGTTSAPAVIGVLYNQSSRNGTSWTFERASIDGWAMSTIGVDMDGDGDTDIVVTDRVAYKLTGDTLPRYDLMGTRWLEHRDGAWVNHTIQGAPYTGDEMFARVTDWNGDGYLDVIEGRSHVSQNSTITVHYGPAFSSSALLYTDTEQGRHYQGLDVGDIDGDGLADLAVTTWESNTCCSDTVVGVYWLRNNGDGTFAYGPVADGVGTKYDNALLMDMDGDGDLDVVAEEQVDQQGLVFFENPGAL